jgi:RNA polymerase sigma-70 factor, ECF subfamily
VDAEAVTRDALAAQQGDQAAAARFVRATQAEVWRLVAHLGGREVADDLTQETYLRAFRALPRFAARSSARTWLLVIARRVCADHVRTVTRRRAAPDRPAETVTADISEQIVLRTLLDSLPAPRREAFVLTQLLGLGYEEAAAVCGCPVGTIRSRVARARDDLVRAMAPARDGRGQRDFPSANPSSRR